MRYGCFGDVHGNLEALEAVIAALAGEQIDRFLCTGDLVGYGPDPAACVDRIRALNATVVAGNHDLGAAGRHDVGRFGQFAQWSLAWTSRALTSEQIAYLAGLPLMEMIDQKITLCHAAIHDLETFPYVKTPDAAAQSFTGLTTQLGVFGHSHICQGWILRGSTITPLETSIIRLETNCQYLFNPGSVGQPRDHDPRAAFAIFDSERSEFQLRRVEYNVEKCRAKFKRDGLSEWFAERLLYGI